MQSVGATTILRFPYEMKQLPCHRAFQAQIHCSSARGMDVAMNDMSGPMANGTLSCISAVASLIMASKAIGYEADGGTT